MSYIRRLAEPHVFPDGKYTFESILAPEGLRAASEEEYGSDIVDPEERWLEFGQCGECGEPDRVMDQVQGLCFRCFRQLSGKGSWL